MIPPLPEMLVRRLAATDRLVEEPPIHLTDARTGAAPRLKTAVRVGLRGAVLCVRFDGRDAGVVATYTGRDDPLWQEDVYEVFLSSLEPPAVYFEFEVNPLGAIFDARIQSPEGRRATMVTQPEWDCPGLQATVRRRDALWSATLRIPLEALAPRQATPSRWRANFTRIDRGPVDEFSAWSPALCDPPDFHVPERFGILKLAQEL